MSCTDSNSKTKTEIIKEIAEQKMVEEFVSNTAKTANEDLKDLVQDIYLILLSYDDKKIEDMYVKGELPYFVSRIICNQYRSETSPFYSHYRKWSNKRSDLKGDLKNKFEEDEDSRWMTKKNVYNS